MNKTTASWQLYGQPTIDLVCELSGTEAAQNPYPKIYQFDASQHLPAPKAEGPGTDALSFLAELEADPVVAAGVQIARQALAEDMGAAGMPVTLATLRLRRGLSQAQLAQATGTSQSRISRIEAGKEDISLQFMRKMVAALGCDYNNLAAALNGTEDI